MRARHRATSLRRGLRTVLLGGISVAGLGLPATAQEATPPRAGAAGGTIQLEGIDVAGQGRGGAGGVVVRREDPRGPVDGYVAKRTLTSTKTDTPLIETPQSVTVISREQIDTIKPQQVADILNYSAGAFGNTFGPDPRVDFFLIRGFTTNDTGLYRDGLQLFNYGFATYKVDPFALERIDVLRGPAAVLFGQGGPGGIVNLISKKPTTEPFNYVEAGGGSFGQKYLAFDFNGQADKEGHWFYRLTGIGRQGGTQVDGLDENRGYIAPTFTYKPDGATTFTFLSSVQYDDTGRLNAFLPYYGTVRPTVLGLRIPRRDNIADPGNNTYRRTQFNVGYEFEHVFDETWTFRQNLRYAYTESLDDAFLGGLFGLSGLGYADANQTQISRYRFRATSRAGLFNVDNQAVARFSDGLFGHTVLMGLDYKNFQLNDNNATGGFGPQTVAPFNILAPNYNSPSVPVAPYLVNYDVFQQLGVYLQDQIKVTPELTLVLSGRGDFTSNEVNNRLASTTTRQTANAFTSRVGLIYNFDFGLAPYVSYASFFNPQVGTNFFSQPFKPTTGDQYEVGVKYEIPGANAVLTLAAFDLALANTLTVDPTNLLNQLQLGETRSRGFEAQLVAAVTPDLNVIGSFTTYNLEVVRGDIGTIGRTPTNVPETLASVYADYTIPTGDWAGFGFGGGARYVGRSFADVSNTLTVPERVLFDAVVHYSRNNWRAAINVANLLDKRFVSACQSVTACFYGEERRVTASLSYKW
ncbi:TonB-dependent siderophore receptor [uncultured Methylobacterium sp.]|jgi:iron complex outermembrane receptor protein|uniref:TonB-dependent siderophore receptor n=1 Tax=uncultured Methylobacterium sp. TaxID=157278 RepID=UPI00261E8C5E|nr:TonB-dependent siderophore receptor [uncultured Methylobacterium sp.]